jgi:hypothetical protein
MDTELYFGGSMSSSSFDKNAHVCEQFSQRILGYIGINLPAVVTNPGITVDPKITGVYPKMRKIVSQ